MGDVLLQVRGLQTTFATERGVVPAVEGVDFDIAVGETVGLVGESGSGKSVSALSLMRLLPDPPAKISGGSVLFEGRDLLALRERDMQQLRGNRLAMIYQEPMTSLNPVHTVGEQIAEVLRLHRGMSSGEAWTEAVSLLTLVGIPLPEDRARAWPHQLSGGMRQRVMIAMALACRPKLLIADEPTTALDVTVQAQILDLLRRLKHEFGMGLLLITHDLGVVAEMCDRVLVMYAGRVVEEADVVSLFDAPLHPYTQGLIASVPRMDGDVEELEAIPGAVPDPLARPRGCAFSTRCPKAIARCASDRPALLPAGAGRKVACHLVETAA
ncbi:ABC transporter ATP-binding protein [uncultured Alsobacter sp.]|uniref:ABC transporter ATP-binding protein n=1 Tax=uncultured Alsobacter sp. TaxID=1748258 RepID=UPI0025E03F98|nr:ABC transporter ATP-binding protein [uncultured Alsobacter sp.]